MINTHPNTFLLPGLLTGLLLVALFVPSCLNEPARYELDISDLSWTIRIDSAAQWEDDTLHLPPVNLEKLAVNPPGMGWEHLEDPSSQKTSLPATVEQYFWNHRIDTAWGAGDYRGVSWFTTSMEIPKSLQGKLLFLDFESVRLRAEVYVNGSLAGYDCIGNTPFQAEISSHVLYGRKNQLAIRITDPGGVYYWEDYHLDTWGSKFIPPSHGFGGITGRVKLLATDSVLITDLHVQNQPEINRVRIHTLVENLQEKNQPASLKLQIKEPVRGKPVVHVSIGQIILHPGKNKLDTLITIPDYLDWDLDHPWLYTVTATLNTDEDHWDESSKRFGLRWFEAREVNGASSFYLNNRRIFLGSAISWGFWPENGIFPTPELAEKQIRNLKILGLNMFNFHRAIGQTRLMELADEMGMLVYEEPGGYRCPSDNIWFWKLDDPSNTVAVSEVDLAWRWRREKLYRMVKRDRSHPSLVIYNMGNEMLMDPDEQHKEDMAGAHSLDPSRHITFSSHSFHPLFFPEYPEGDCPRDTAKAKLFMKPFDSNFYCYGWWDNHHALGEGSYRDRYYNGPTDYNLYSDNRKEIVFYGEEGAIHAPARLDSIIPVLDREGIRGWDSGFLRKSHGSITSYLNSKGFEAQGITLEYLADECANNAYYYHGKMIENCRIGNVVDGYVINGLEDPKRAFYSGVLDVYRNIKGDPGLISKYMKPLYLAVKPMHKIVIPGHQVELDIHLVNEKILQGAYSLELFLRSGADTLDSYREIVNISGGEMHGELLAEALELRFPLYQPSGYLDIEARLMDSDGEVSRGQEQVYVLPGPFLPGGLDLYLEGVDTAIRSCLEGWQCNLLPFHPQDSASALLILTDTSGQERMEEIMDWVFSGHTLAILGSVVPWMIRLDEEHIIKFHGVLSNETEWSAGGFFNREHPLFEGLAAPGIMGWEYQDLTNDFKERHSLLLEGESAIVGAFGGEPDQVGTAVGEIRYGSGTIVFSTLNLESALLKNHPGGSVGECFLQNVAGYYSELH